MEMELEYYRIGWRYVAGCLTSPDITHLQFRGCREKAYAFFNYPEWCLPAKIYMLLDLFFIIVSIAEV